MTLEEVGQECARARVCVCGGGVIAIQNAQLQEGGDKQNPGNITRGMLNLHLTYTCMHLELTSRDVIFESLHLDVVPHNTTIVQ